MLLSSKISVISHPCAYCAVCEKETLHVALVYACMCAVCSFEKCLCNSFVQVEDEAISDAWWCFVCWLILKNVRKILKLLMIFYNLRSDAEANLF